MHPQTSEIDNNYDSQNLDLLSKSWDHSRQDTRNCAPLLSLTRRDGQSSLDVNKQGAQSDLGRQGFLVKNQSYAMLPSTVFNPKQESRASILQHATLTCKGNLAQASIAAPWLGHSQVVEDAPCTFVPVLCGRIQLPSENVLGALFVPNQHPERTAVLHHALGSTS